MCRANPWNERGRRCNKASRERNMARRQQLPLRLQSSSISRGRQIKLLTQYPLYPYNKDKYGPLLPLSLSLSLSLFFLSFLHSLQFVSQQISKTENSRRAVPFLSADRLYSQIFRLCDSSATFNRRTKEEKKKSYLFRNFERRRF